MQALLRRLNQPFPSRNSGFKHFAYFAGVGAFVTLFLYTLRPFGIGNASDHLFLICLGFGGITFLVASLYDLVMHYVFHIRTDVPSWTLWKWLLQTTGVLLFIAVGNFLFLDWLAHGSVSRIDIWADILINTLLVGIFPVTFSGLMIQMHALRTNQKKADEIQPQLHPEPAATGNIIDLSPGAGQEFQIEANNLRFIEARQNYVSVSFIEDGQLRQETLRSTIARMEEQLVNTSVVRCHRSFLVNVEVIERVAGNAQGLRLTLPQVEGLEIPVSRSYIPRLRELIQA